MKKSMRKESKTTGLNTTIASSYHPSVSSIFTLLPLSEPCVSRAFGLIADMQSTIIEEAGASPLRILFIAEQ